MNEIEKIKQLIQQPSKVVVVSHQSPDGDSIGSSLATLHLLNELGHQVTPIIPDAAPAFLHWLPHFDQVLVYDKESYGDFGLTMDWRWPPSIAGTTAFTRGFGYPHIAVLGPKSK